MTKVKNFLILCTLFFLPTIVMAADDFGDISLVMIIGMEAFISIHMTLFFHMPLAEILSGGKQNNEKYKKIFLSLIIARIIILIIGDLLLGFVMFIIDFITVFVGAFIIVPIVSKITNVGPFSSSFSKTEDISVGFNSTLLDKKTSSYMVKKYNTNNKVEYNMEESKATLANKSESNVKVCSKCGISNDKENTYCTNCGTPFSIAATLFSKEGYCPRCHAKLNPGVLYCTNCGLELSNPVSAIDNTIYVTESLDPLFQKSEDLILKDIIDSELERNHFEKGMVIPEVRRRKLLFTALFALVTFLTVCLFFFHVPLYFYLIYIIFFIIYLVNTLNYSVNKYIVKQLKSRPDEKVSNVVSSIVANAKKSTGAGFEYVALFLVAFILPLVFFSKPRIFYEKMDDGYGVRFYAFGLTEFRSATIPDEYKGEPVVSLRGNTFSNMFFLEEVTLPDTITEIRGQAFKNDFMLKRVNIPEKLEYLGGGAFYNCSSLRSIEFPDSVTFIGGESFYNASSLREVKLPEGITEIRGNTFENCVSLEKINIPDNVTRIGGHAFYGNSSLSEVKISPKSQLHEIGSSAFRQCNNLKVIYIPLGTIVNERAFKESPTTVYRYTDVDSSSYNKVMTRTFDVDDSWRILDSEVYDDLRFTLLDYISNGYNDYTMHFSVSGDISDDFYLTSDTSYVMNDNLMIAYHEVDYKGRFVIDFYYN